MTLLATAMIGCAYGVAHGLAPDHCAALATLLVRGGDRRSAMSASLRFGVGHALVLGVLAGAVGLTGWLIPPAWERIADGLAGTLLALLGALALARALPLLVHRHVHTHRGAHDHAHWHAHVGDQERHRHTHALLLGGVFAVGGVRALAIALAPLLLAGHSLRGAVVFVLAFGTGITVAMIGFGLLFHAGQRRVGPGRRDLASATVGAVSLLVGGWWMWLSLA